MILTKWLCHVKKKSSLRLTVVCQPVTLIYPLWDKIHEKVWEKQRFLNVIESFGFYLSVFRCGQNNSTWWQKLIVVVWIFFSMTILNILGVEFLSSQWIIFLSCHLHDRENIYGWAYFPSDPGMGGNRHIKPKTFYTHFRRQCQDKQLSTLTFVYLHRVEHNVINLIQS